jgi:quinol monooxygenase YgiN
VDISIRENADPTTLIVVFVVEPENQDELIQVLKDGVETVMSKEAGCLGASFLKSKDGRRVISYAQWRSAKDIEAGPDRKNPEVAAYFERVKALARFEPIVCAVSYVHCA